MATLLAEALRGLSLAAVLLAMLAVFAAAFLRGFTGFGFALAAVPSLSLILDPEVVVPCTLVLGLIAGAQVLPKLRSLVDWRSVWWLLGGSLVGAPLGVWLLASLSPNAMRIAIGAVLIGAVLVLWRQPRMAAAPSAFLGVAAGFASGVLNGGTAMGGPPVVLYFLASAKSLAIGRASLVMYFFLSSLGAVAYAAAQGLVGRHVLLLSVLFLPTLYVGNWLGDHAFDASSAAAYRKVALGVLLGLALLAVGRALIAEL